MLESPRPAAGRTILVTGFGGFPGSPRNPTERIAAALRREVPRLARLGIELHCAVLPVRYDGLQARLDELARARRPDAWLLLGVAGRRRQLCIERVARNRANPLRPDAARRCPPQRLVERAPGRLASTLPCRRLLAVLRAAGLPVRLSHDAGDYLCNAALYRALSASLAPEIGFLHVPAPRATRTGRTGMPPRRRVTQAELTRAALLSVLALARPVPERRAILRRDASGTLRP